MKEYFKNKLLKLAWISVLFAVVGCPSLYYSYVSAAETSVLKGRITGVEEQVVEGAMVFVYSSEDVRKAADFISAPTDKGGLFRMVVPPGKYWVVARLKMTEDFGPLMPGDKHSGDPEVIEITRDSEVNTDFIVADLKEAIKMKREEVERLFTIRGKIIDENGAPLIRAYAIANSKEKFERFPKYISAWVDDMGNYTLYVPRGKHFIGGAVTFPSGQDYYMISEVTVESDMQDFEIMLKSTNNK